MSSIIDRIKLAEFGFASGRMRCIGWWCGARLDDQSQSFTVGPTLQVLWWEGGILVIEIPDFLDLDRIRVRQRIFSQQEELL